jgi:hypothetical protein
MGKFWRPLLPRCGGCLAEFIQRKSAQARSRPTALAGAGPVEAAAGGSDEREEGGTERQEGGREREEVRAEVGWGDLHTEEGAQMAATRRIAVIYSHLHSSTASCSTTFAGQCASSSNRSHSSSADANEIAGDAAHRAPVEQQLHLVLGTARLPAPRQSTVPEAAQPQPARSRA